MDYKLHFVFVVLINVALSINEEDYFYNERHPVKSYDSASLNNFNRETTNYNVPRYEAAPRYEVTEHVIDIPDDREPKGPIVTNYTSTKPLNKVINAVGNNDDKKLFDKNKKQNRDKSTYYHSIHESEYNEHSGKKITNKVHKEIIPNLKEFIHGPKSSFMKGLHNALDKEFNNANKGFIVPNVLAAPILFLNKFHKKSEKAAKKVHQTIFEQEFDDFNDDYL